MTASPCTIRKIEEITQFFFQRVPLLSRSKSLCPMTVMEKEFIHSVENFVVRAEYIFIADKLK